ncbi:transposase [Natrinema mahii]|nr:transposase [Natrinema mahii]
MFIGIDVHKRYSQIAVLDQNGEIVEEVRVENANLDDFAQQYAGSKAALEATSNYYHIHDTLSEYLDVTVANPGELKLISDSDKKTDRVDVKQLARMVRLGSIPESYVPTDELLAPAHLAGSPACFPNACLARSRHCSMKSRRSISIGQNRIPRLHPSKPVISAD